MLICHWYIPGITCGAAEQLVVLAHEVPVRRQLSGRQSNRSRVAIFHCIWPAHKASSTALKYLFAAPRRLRRCGTAPANNSHGTWTPCRQPRRWSRKGDRGSPTCWFISTTCPRTTVEPRSSRTLGSASARVRCAETSRAGLIYYPKERATFIPQTLAQTLVAHVRFLPRRSRRFPPGFGSCVLPFLRGCAGLSSRPALAARRRGASLGAIPSWFSSQVDSTAHAFGLCGVSVVFGTNRCI